MGAFDKLLGRWGYAKLDRYGLILTPDERVISTRPAVLDDGLGGKIVGWLDGDLAAMELEHYGGRPKPKAKRLAAAPRLQPPPKPMPEAASVVAPAAPFAAPVTKPVEPPAPKPLPGMPPIAAAPAPAPVPVVTPPARVVAAPAPAVAAEPVVEEDEWEWEIAMARARAAADEVEQARVDLLGATAVIASAVIERKPSLLPPPVKPIATDSWGDTKTSEAYTPPAARKTVIPVPTLPTAANPADVRPAAYSPSPRRVARGTGRLEETVKTQPAPPANDDQTSPYVTLPSEVKPVGFAHTKRVAAK